MPRKRLSILNNFLRGVVGKTIVRVKNEVDFLKKIFSKISAANRTVYYSWGNTRNIENLCSLVIKSDLKVKWWSHYFSGISNTNDRWQVFDFGGGLPYHEISADHDKLQTFSTYKVIHIQVFSHISGEYRVRMRYTPKMYTMNSCGNKRFVVSLTQVFI